jgi:tRNA-uridine 2-sulfurtransferase
MSGGLMSGVVAALLKHQGFQVLGLHLQFSEKVAATDQRLEKMTHKLGINLINVDTRGEWEYWVRDHVVHQMASGSKPEPDRLATHRLLFSLLLEKADELKCTHVATGHIARVALDPETNRTRLLKTQQEGDQSGLLYQIAPENLGRFILPMGDLSHSAVEKLGAELGLDAEHLKAAEAKSSSDVGISGITKDDYLKIAVSSIAPGLFPPGQVKFSDGLVIGEHGGVYRYYVGQKHGLPQLRLPQGQGMRAEGFVVTALDQSSQTVFVGPESQLEAQEVTAEGAHWVRAVDGLKLLKCRGRFLGEGTEKLFACQVTLFENDLVYVEFQERQRIAGPGQSIVFYQEDEVIGGAVLCQTRTPPTS